MTKVLKGYEERKIKKMSFFIFNFYKLKCIFFKSLSQELSQQNIHIGIILFLSRDIGYRS
jgi:hypothetical protein